MASDKLRRAACPALLLAALCLTLSSCEMKVEDDLFKSNADTSISIALPYATVTPPPAAQIEARALEIDETGSVRVNDAASVLSSEQSGTSDSNYKSLRQGNTGLAVQALQSRLKELGYYTAAISGLFDDETEASVRRFEQTYGTMQTGVATSDFQTRLFADDAIAYGSAAYSEAVVAQYKVLKPGDVGSAVYALQQRLRTLSYPIDNLTGIYDDATTQAVKLFYEAYKLAPSKIATVSLQQELYSDAAKRYSKAKTSATESKTVSSMLGDTIDDLQTRLTELGYLVNVASGSYDVHTETAVKLFEEANGKQPSITMDDDARALLFSEKAVPFDKAYAQYANLIEGASGDNVLKLQQRLVALGFLSGTPNGEFGPATTDSIKLFQLRNSLDETGVASRYDQAVLFSSFALNIDGVIPEPEELPEETKTKQKKKKRSAAADGPLTTGSTGEVVTDLQNRLTELGYVTSATGTYDNLTARAVSNFQTAVGVESNGAADEQLIAFLMCDAAPVSGVYLHARTMTYTTLKKGDSGQNVMNLQKRLWKLGYLDSALVKNSKGRFNDATVDALKAFQEAIGMENCDGIASPALMCFVTANASDKFKKTVEPQTPPTE